MHIAVQEMHADVGGIVSNDGDAARRTSTSGTDTWEKDIGSTSYSDGGVVSRSFARVPTAGLTHRLSAGSTRGSRILGVTGAEKIREWHVVSSKRMPPNNVEFVSSAGERHACSSPIAATGPASRCSGLRRGDAGPRDDGDLVRDLLGEEPGVVDKRSKQAGPSLGIWQMPNADGCTETAGEPAREAA